MGPVNVILLALGVALGGQLGHWPFHLATFLAEMLSTAAKVRYQAHACSHDMIFCMPALARAQMLQVPESF